MLTPASHRLTLSAVYAEQRDQEFAWTAEHRQLRETVRAVLASRAPVSRARELAGTGARHDPELWAALAGDIGLQGLALPEEHGGSGATLVELAVVADEMGRVLHGGPFLSTVALAAPALLAADDPVAAEYLPRIAEGELTATLALDARVTADPGGRLTGGADLVLDGADADLLLVPAGPDLYAVEAGTGVGTDGLERTDLDVLDGTRRIGRLRFGDVAARRVGEPGSGAVAVAAARRVAAVVVAAEQVGGMEACVARTAEYARTRRQFGRLIGSFQGVKHRLADMAVRLELGRAAAYWAAWQQPGDQEFELGALVARAFCSPAYLQTAFDTIQLHGGIGFTWEHDAHLYVRRARADLSLLGTPAQVRAELEPLVLAAAAALSGAAGQQEGTAA
jgi:alkylation response protein AidB-like acyl-CoA dehydrogenase